MKFKIKELVPDNKYKDIYEVIISGCYGDMDADCKGTVLACKEKMLDLYHIFTVIESNQFEECAELEEYCGDFGLMEAYEDFPRDYGWECDTGTLPSMDSCQVFYYDKNGQKFVCVIEKEE